MIILIYAATMILIGLIIFNDKLNFAVGFITGIIIDYIWLYDINRVIKKSVNLQENKAITYYRLNTIIRVIIITLVIVTVLFINKKLLAGLFLGLIGFKLSAYLSGIISTRRDKIN